MREAHLDRAVDDRAVIPDELELAIWTTSTADSEQATSAALPAGVSPLRLAVASYLARFTGANRRAYDLARRNLDRHAVYILAAYLADAS